MFVMYDMYKYIHTVSVQKLLNQIHGPKEPRHLIPKAKKKQHVTNTLISY